jgi:hypothetical protein
MLINNRPDGMTGIAQAANMRKVMKRSEKVGMYSEAMMMSKSMGSGCGMY